MNVLEYVFQCIVDTLKINIELFSYHISLFNILMFLVVGTVLCIILVRLLDI